MPAWGRWQTKCEKTVLNHLNKFLPARKKKAKESESSERHAKWLLKRIQSSSWTASLSWTKKSSDGKSAGESNGESKLSHNWGPREPLQPSAQCYSGGGHKKPGGPGSWRHKTTWAGIQPTMPPAPVHTRRVQRKQTWTKARVRLSIPSARETEGEKERERERERERETTGGSHLFPNEMDYFVAQKLFQPQHTHTRKMAIKSYNAKTRIAMIFPRGLIQSDIDI